MLKNPTYRNTAGILLWMPIGAAIWLMVVLAFCGCAKKPTPPPAPTITTTDSVATIPVPRPVRHMIHTSPVPVPTLVHFAKGSAFVTPLELAHLKRVSLRRAITVTGYASNERGKRTDAVERARNFVLSLNRAIAVCNAVTVTCKPIAGGETGSISPVLEGNRIAGFIP